MSFAAVVDAVRDKFRDEVATPNSLVVTHDNAPPPSLSQNWYRLTVLPDSTVMVHTGAVGSRRYRIVGRAVLNLFCAASKGDAALLAIVDAVNDAFLGSSIADPIIVFRDPPYLSGPADRDDAWFRRTLTIPFEADVFG